MKKKTIKQIGVLILTGILIGESIGAYMWFKPHRNVQSTEVYAEIKVKDLVNEFSNNNAAANEKYLSSDGNSKVLIVEGRVSRITKNQEGVNVLILKEKNAEVGVSATFTKETSAHVNGIKEGDVIRIKGAITAGNSYAKDLDLYEHAVLIQCDVVK